VARKKIKVSAQKNKSSLNKSIKGIKSIRNHQYNLSQQYEVISCEGEGTFGCSLPQNFICVINGIG
jgi:hypothetical protein